MERKGFIYKISNDVNDKVYIGQTSRSIELRFSEHCFDKRATSKIHKAIQEIGYIHFKCEAIEECDIENLDEREKYWISYYNSCKEGYNTQIGGHICAREEMNQYNHVLVEGANIVFDSQEEMGRKISEITLWGERFATDKIRESLTTGKLFLDTYRLIPLDQGSDISSIDECEEWIKKLTITHCGKKVKLIELDKDFETATEAAVYVLTNSLYTGVSRTPLQTVISSIRKAIKTGGSVDTISNYHFEELPGSTKNPGTGTFEKKEVYCPQLDTTFPSVTDTANFFVVKKLWGKMKVKTAKLRVGDILRGYYREYMGYTFQTKDENGKWIAPKMLEIQLPYLGDKKVNIDWTADDDIKEEAWKFYNR